jgi:YfiR/HmsC-like
MVGCGWSVVLLALLGGLIPGRLDAQANRGADRAEAIYLKKMLSFVQWPADPGIPGEAFRVCVAGSYRNSFVFAEEMRGITVEGRKIEVRSIRKEENLKNCQVLFIGSPEPNLRAKLLESVKGTPILTVGDDAGFLEAGGILELAYTGSAIQFTVNLRAARNAGLKIDARLLALAQRVLTEKEATGI